VAYGKNLLDAYDRATRLTRISFRRIIAFNGELDAATASAIVERQLSKSSLRQKFRLLQ